MRKPSITWGNAARLPLVPLRVLLLCLAYYVFQPLADACEWAGSKVPGLKE